MPPRYLISPAAQTKPVWFPDVFQFVIGHDNPSYLNSLWLGIGWNLAILPYRIAREFLWAIFNFQFQVALLSLFVIPVSAVWLVVRGMFGQVSAHNLPMHLMEQSVVLNTQQSLQAIACGYTDVLIDIDSLPDAETV